MSVRGGREGGFTLTNVLVSAAVAAVFIFGVRYYISWRAREQAAASTIARMQDIRDRALRAARLDLSWKNSMRAMENTSMACLRDHTSCYEKGGPMALRDDKGRLIVDATNPRSGFTLDGHICSAFQDGGFDGCPIRLEVRWRPQCSGDCVDPKSVQILGTLRFRPSPRSSWDSLKVPDIEFGLTRNPEPGDPRNCQDLMAGGRTENGTYSVRPDGALPAFPVYCDFKRDGGGWALVAANDTLGANVMPESNIVEPNSNGRLPGAKITALLNVSDFLSENNLRLELPGIDGGLVLGASTNGSVEPVAYVAPVPAGDCRSVSPIRNIARHTAAANFTLEFEGGGLLGLTEKSDRAGLFGFHACFGASFLGKECGKGCERSWVGNEVRQKGLIWVR